MMDSFELTKIAAAVLSALLVMVGFKTLVEIKMAGHHGEEHAGYSLPMPKETAAAPAAGAAEPAAFDAAAVAAKVASADAAAGQDVFKKCTACHTIESGGAAKIGPNLHGVVGRNKGSAPGFGYSDGMKSKGGAWTTEDLAHFIHNPKGYVSGTKMVFAGIKDNGDLANLLAYLSSQK